MLVGTEQITPGAEDEDVVGSGGHCEEEHLELEADPQEDPTSYECQDTAVHRVLYVSQREVGERARRREGGRSKRSEREEREMQRQI